MSWDVAVLSSKIASTRLRRILHCCKYRQKWNLLRCQVPSKSIHNPNCERATSELLQHLAVPAWSTTKHSFKNSGLALISQSLTESVRVLSSCKERASASSSVVLAGCGWEVLERSLVERWRNIPSRNPRIKKIYEKPVQAVSAKNYSDVLQFIWLEIVCLI